MYVRVRVLCVCSVGASTGVRGMATLQEMKRRIDSVANMSKITASMKMVSAAKLRRAELAFEPAKVMGASSSALPELMGQPEEKPETRLVIAVSADKGLCGAANTVIAKKTMKIVDEDKAAGIETVVVTVGDKARGTLTTKGYDVEHAFNEFGKAQFSHAQASYIADVILSEVEFDVATIIHNEFVNVITYNTVEKPVLSPEKMTEQMGSALSHYNLRGDRHLMENYAAAHLANALFAAVRENATVEFSQRMSAMDSASTNASDMIEKLSIVYNRERQAAITTELTEIISGAASLEG